MWNVGDAGINNVKFCKMCGTNGNRLGLFYKCVFLLFRCMVRTLINNSVKKVEIKFVDGVFSSFRDLYCWA